MKKIIVFMSLLLMMIFSVSALTILSAGKVDFTSNDPKLDAPAFVITATENSAKEFVIYSIDELSPELPDGFSLANGGTIKAQLTDYSVSYPVKEGNSVYTLDIDWVEKWIITESTRNEKAKECNNLANHYAVVEDTLAFDTVYCVEAKKIGSFGSFGSGANFLFNEEFTITPQGKSPKVVTISNEDTSDSAGDDLYISWEGFVGSLQTIPTPSADYNAFYSALGNWYLIDKTDTSSTSEIALQTVLNHLWTSSDCQDNEESLQACLNVHNNNVYESTKKVSYSGLNADIIGSQTNGRLELRDTPIYEFPLYRLRINADWIGVTLPVGKPEIISLDAKEFSQGSSGYIESKVKNDANVEAGFRYDFSCENGVSVNSQTYSFNAGETRTIKHYVFGQSSSKTEAKCTLIVKDNSNSNVRDTDDVIVPVVSNNQCSDTGVQECFSDTPVVCKNVDGVDVWSPLSSKCSEGCFINENDKAQCNESDVAVTQQDDELTTTLLIIITALVILFGIWYFTRKPSSGGL